MDNNNQLNSMRTIIFTSCFFYIFIFQSCVFENNQKKIDAYYTSKYWGEQRPRIPLFKPLSIYKDRMTPDKWGIDYDDLVSRGHNFTFNHTLEIDSIINIGVDKSYVYGKIFEKKYQEESFIIDVDYIYAYKYGGTTWKKENHKSSDNEIQIYPFDSINKIFILPERWFVINVADSTTEAFFSKLKYENYIKERGISRRMYNIDSINKVYRRTGILPWFPESVKIKLRNK